MISGFNFNVPSQDDLQRRAAERRERAEGALGFIAFVGFIYALFRQDYLLVGLIGVYLATSLAVFIYRRFGYRATAVEVRIRPQRVFPEQTIELRVRFMNRKRLPLPWVRLGLALPRTAELEDLEATKTPLYLRLVLPLVIGGRAIVERRVSMRIRTRGAHPLGDTELSLTDPLGLESISVTLPTRGQALVYPKLLPLDAHLRQNLPLGDRRGRSFVDEMSRYLGPRAYRPGDPPRRIDWRRTAVLGELYVKTYETVATSASAIFLDPTTARNTWEGINVEVQERTISVAASIAHNLIGRGEAVGLYVTGVFSETGGHRPFSMRERPRAGAHQLGRILEALAQLRQPGLFRNLPGILQEEVPRLDYAVQLIVVAPHLTHDLARVLERVSRSRRVFFLGTDRPVPVVDAAIPRGVRTLQLERMQ